ncbi:MAG: FAD-dependent oxidoreductase, partial [Clostridia bacterium]|nr:FAD-dependent oxidoreductase [Clostridia bacterium]
MTDKENIFDVAVIGAGVIGCAVARELTRRRARILVLDRESDVGEGTSKANSAIIHGGFDAKPGTLKAKYNVLGNAMMDRVSGELDVPFSRIGALVVSRSAEGDETVRELLARGEKNGVKDLKILSGDEARAVEPGLTDEVTSALFCPSSGVVCPFELTLGYAENAVKNG